MQSSLFGRLWLILLGFNVVLPSGHGLCLVSQSILSIEPLEMGPDGADGDPKGSGDLFVGQAVHRQYAGWQSPAQAITDAGGFYYARDPHAVNTCGSGGTWCKIPYFWTTGFNTDWQAFVTNLAAAYDNKPEIATVSMSRDMTVFAEPFIRQTSDKPVGGVPTDATCAATPQKPAARCTTSPARMPAEPTTTPPRATTGQ
jgi:hypothetical protein